MRYTAPLLDATCSILQQNQYTKIRRVCFNGAKPAIIDAIKTFSAIFCTMKPVGTDSSWNGGIIPPNVGEIWCWTVFTPKCASVNQSTGCILACNTPCCMYEMRWVQTANGPSLSEPSSGEWYCTIGGDNCGQNPCVEIGCPERESCCERD